MYLFLTYHRLILFKFLLEEATDKFKVETLDHGTMREKKKVASQRGLPFVTYLRNECRRRGSCWKMYDEAWRQLIKTAQVHTRTFTTLLLWSQELQILLSCFNWKRWVMDLSKISTTKVAQNSPKLILVQAIWFSQTFSATILIFPLRALSYTETRFQFLYLPLKEWQLEFDVKIGIADFAGCNIMYNQPFLTNYIWIHIMLWRVIDLWARITNSHSVHRLCKARTFGFPFG